MSDNLKLPNLLIIFIYFFTISAKFSINNTYYFYIETISFQTYYYAAYFEEPP